MAAWTSGGGRTVKIRHASGYESGYLHLSSFGPGVRAGVHVVTGPADRQASARPASPPGRTCTTSCKKNGAHRQPRGRAPQAAAGRARAAPLRWRRSRPCATRALALAGQPAGVTCELETQREYNRQFPCHPSFRSERFVPRRSRRRVAAVPYDVVTTDEARAAGRRQPAQLPARLASRSSACRPTRIPTRTSSTSRRRRNFEQLDRAGAAGRRGGAEPLPLPPADGRARADGRRRRAIPSTNTIATSSGSTRRRARTRRTIARGTSSTCARRPGPCS